MRPENPIGEPFIELAEVGSTNNYAMQQVQTQMAEHGTVWFAHHQTAGRGQRGKTWVTASKENITMSVLLHTHSFNIQRQFTLHAIIAVACHDFFERCTGSTGLEVKIKWPNDLYWKDRKAGGILIENLIRGNLWKYAIAGIGININQTIFENLTQAVSLQQITGQTYEPVLLARELCTCLEHRWLQFHKEGDTEILASYNRHLYKKGEQVWFKKGDEVFDAMVQGVSNDGNLAVYTGVNTFLSYGAVQWLVNKSDKGDIF